MKTTRIIVMMAAFWASANARADITLFSSSADMEVRTTGPDEQITNAFDVTEFSAMLTTNNGSMDTNVTVTADQNTQASFSGNSFSFVSTGNSDIKAIPSGDVTAPGNATTDFSLDFTVTEPSTFSLSGTVTVDTQGDFGSTEAEVTYDGPAGGDTNIFLDFDSSDDPGAPRQVSISASGELSPGTASLFLFVISTLSDSQDVSHAHWDLTVSVSPGGTPPPPSNTVEVVALEVAQSIQDWNNSIPLVSNKATFVRAHFQATADQVVTGKLRGFRDGGELPGSPLSSINAGETAIVSTNPAALRGELFGSLNFLLPQSWRFGTIDLQVEPESFGLDPLQFTCRSPLQTGTVANSCMTQVTFTDTSPLLVKFVKIKQLLPSGQAVNTPSDADVLEIASRIKATFPIDTVHYTFDTLPLPAGSSTNLNFLSSVNAELRAFRQFDGCEGDPTCQRIYFGVLRGFTTRYGGVTPGEPAIVACAFVTDPSDEGFTRQFAPHELGHALGRPHPVSSQGFGTGPCPALPGVSGVLGACGECENGNPPDFPDFSNVNGNVRPTLGPLDVAPENVIFGLDTYLRQALDPTNHFELMSYCGPKYPWASRFTYTNLLTAITTRFAGAQTPQAFAPVAVTNLLVVRGSVDIVTDAVTFSPFALIGSSVVPSAPPPGDFTLQLLDTGSNVVTEVSFRPDLDSENETSFGTFTIAVPADPTITQAVIQHSGTIIGTKTASANSPTVQIVFPNGGETITNDPVVFQWNGADADGDALSYVIQYSADGGATFKTLAVDWPDQTFPIERSLLTGSDAALVRVIASDGFNSASDDSDATFSVPNNAPQVFILTPTEGEMFSGNQHIFLEAFALDREDGELAGANLQWNSSLDGALGTGTEIDFPASQLSDGSHMISVIATDGGSLAATASVTIVVSALAPPSLADLVVTKEGPTNIVVVGEHTTFTVTVNNQGPNTATDVTLTDPLPVNTAFISALASQGDCSVVSNSIVCNLGAIAAGKSATSTVVLRPTAEGDFTNAAAATSAVADPVPANNVATTITSVGPAPAAPHDLAVIKLKAPKKIALSATTTNKLGKFSVSIQNRGMLTETIPDLDALNDLVTVAVETLGTDCASFLATLVPPKTPFPINLAPNKKLNLTFIATFDCANDPAATTRTAAHNDYQTVATVDLGALDEVDTVPANDNCPRPPNPAIGDPGCGNKDPVTKQLGAPVVTDVVVKQ